MVIRSTPSDKGKATNVSHVRRGKMEHTNKTVKRLSRKVNLSRKQILAARSALMERKKMQQKVIKKAAKQTRAAEVQKMTNKKVIKTFDKHILHIVQEGLVDAISSLGESVTPLSLFMASLTALSKSPEKHQVPYLLSIISACISRISQGMLHRQCETLFALCEQLIAEHVNTNELIVTKAMKLIQTLLLSTQQPTVQLVYRFVQFNPSKLRASLAELYLITFRKLLEHAALCTILDDFPRNSSNDNNINNNNSTSNKKITPVSDKTSSAQPQHKSSTTHWYTLSSHQLFFISALPEFVNICMSNVSEMSANVAITSLRELSSLFTRTLSPYIVESKEGSEMINDLLRDQLLSLLKPVHQPFWTHALEVLESLFNRLSYVKRLPEQAEMPFTTKRFPAVVFLLKVLNKMRVMDNAQLNSKVERVIVAIGNGMTVKEFVNVLPFDARLAYEAEIRGYAHVPQQQQKEKERNEVNEGDSNNDEYDEEYGDDVYDEQEEYGNQQTNNNTKKNHSPHKNKFTKCVTHDQRRVDAQTLWSTSYTLNILRRTSSHDSLPFCLEYFFPQIQFCSRHAVEAERADQHDEFNRWSALLIQFWRVVVGFCHYPIEINNNSFRDLAKQLVGLLSHDTFVDISANALHILCSGYYKLSQTEPLYDDDEDINNNNVYDDDEDNNNDTRSDVLAGNNNNNTNGKNSNVETKMRNINANSSEHFKNSVKTASRSHQQRLSMMHKEPIEDDELFLRLNDCEWAPHSYHNITVDKAREVCTTIFAKYSANIMPKLCNTYEAHQTTTVLQAISSFAKVCNSSVLVNILTGILAIGTSVVQASSEETGVTSDTTSTNKHPPQNASHNNNRNNSNEEEHTRATAQRRIVLDIACAVLPQLSMEQLTTLFNEVIEPVLIDPQPTSRLLQKKAYKLLYAVFEHRIKDVRLLFPRIAGALTLGRQHLTISGMKMRLRCLEWMLDACKMFYPSELFNCVRSMIGEVVICAREQANETRLLSMSIIEKMQRYLVSTAHAAINSLLHLILAGLSGKTAMMLSSTLVCAAKVVYLTHHELEEKDLNNITRVTFAMMESTMPEVRSAAAIFARMMLKLAKRSSKVHNAIMNSLNLLLHAIALITSQPRVSSGVRVQMRVLLEKCIKRFGYNQLDPIFPIGSKNFLRYAQKMLKQAEKKAELELRRKVQRQSQNAFDKLFMNTATVSDNVEEDLLQAGALTTFVAQHSTPSASSLLINSEHNKHLNNANTGTSMQIGSELYEDEFDNMHLEFEGDKLRIMSVNEKRGEEELHKRQALAEKLLGRAHAMANPDALNADGLSRPGKRGRANDDEMQDIENEELILRYGNKNQASSINTNTRNNTFMGATSASTSEKSMTVNGKLVGPSVRQINNLREQKREKQELKRRRVEEDIRKGDEFVGSGAGDVKRGNVDPFAYVPLNRRFMNRRNARQALHRFQILSTKHLKGEKAKTRNT